MDTDLVNLRDDAVVYRGMGKKPEPLASIVFRMSPSENPYPTVIGQEEQRPRVGDALLAWTPRSGECLFVFVSAPNIIDEATGKFVSIVRYLTTREQLKVLWRREIRGKEIVRL